MSTSAKYHLPDSTPERRHITCVESWDGKGIAPSYIAKAEEFEAITGLQVHPKAFDLAPQGARIHVIREPVPEEYGSIQLPEEYRRAETMGIGWVLAVGPLAHLDVPLPFGPILDHPSRLLYCKVLMSQTIGSCVRLSVTEREYRSNVVVMTTRDIWSIDFNPENKIGEIES